MTPYHKWLIRQRRWCEHEGCRMVMEPAMCVRNINGKDLVMCSEHAIRLDAVRKSERQQWNEKAIKEKMVKDV